MAPPRYLITKLPDRSAHFSKEVLLTTLHFMFSVPGTDRIIVEPDAANSAANKLVARTGFRFQKEIQLSYKKANLYWYTKEDFLSEHPV
jgi:penicillin amidase